MVKTVMRFGAVMIAAAGLLQPVAAQSQGIKAVRPMNIMRDAGHLIYYKDGKRIATSEFRWNEDGSFYRKALVFLEDQHYQTELRINVDAESRWNYVTLDTPNGRIEIDRSGTLVAMTVQGEMSTADIPLGSIILEDGSPALMSQAVVAYDAKKGGKQKFPVFFAPGAVIDSKLEYLRSFERVVGGRIVTFREFRYMLPPVYPVELIVDDANRVCLARYPTQQGLFVRDGYDVLNVSHESEELISQPRHTVRLDRDVAVAMADGVELATDIYRPAVDGAFPVILVRTPHGKYLIEEQARYFARRGYAVAVQDVRGRSVSPGRWEPFVHEAADGHDTIEWLAAQEWSDGSVGMIGGSYLAWVQWAAASRKPPQLKALIPVSSLPEPFRLFPYRNGVLSPVAALAWSASMHEDLPAGLWGLDWQGTRRPVDTAGIGRLPLVELDRAVLGVELPEWREWTAHPSHDRHWKSLGYLDALAGTDLPVLHVAGWFDGSGAGSISNFAGLTARGAANQKLIVGPWEHGALDSRSEADGTNWGRGSVVDLQTVYLRWMDRWLKGIENGIEEEPAVSLFVTGANDWLRGATYPLEGTRITKLYLAGGADTEEAVGQGVLDFEAPAAAGSTPDRFSYDPGDPTPDELEGRRDLLVYSTPPLTEPLTLAGPVSAVLHAASSARDTDWVVRLDKLDEKGSSVPVAEGIVRARLHRSTSKPKRLKPGRVYEYRIDMGHAAMTVNRDERLRLVVSSALFPAYARNLNTGGSNETGTEFVTAEQTVYHDEEHPSHLLLPVASD